jgi:MFS family permease
VGQPGGADRWLGLAGLSVGVALVMVDSSLVNVAIPRLIDDFGIGFGEAVWLNTIYSLVFAATLIPFGRAADRHGRRRVFLLGLALFLAASLLAGLAPSAAALLGARFLQALGGAAMLPSSLSTINSTFQGRQRLIAFASGDR